MVDHVFPYHDQAIRFSRVPAHGTPLASLPYCTRMRPACQHLFEVFPIFFLAEPLYRAAHFREPTYPNLYQFATKIGRYRWADKLSRAPVRLSNVYRTALVVISFLV